MNKNINEKVVEDFGREWSNFNQRQVPEKELNHLFNQYFSIFPEQYLSENAIGFDLGCGSGRWAQFIAPRVKALYCIDPSKAALDIAKENLKEFDNCKFHQASVDSIPIQNNSMDFGYALGVLHHVPNTENGIDQCARILKPGAPLLLYLYYAFDNRPVWFRVIWKISDLFRQVISLLPFKIKKITCFIIALIVYLPMSRLALIVEILGVDVSDFPLAEYRNRSFYTMCTDALDRFGTRLEKRFTRDEILHMLIKSGLEKIEFRQAPPYWCVIGFKKKPSD